MPTTVTTTAMRMTAPMLATMTTGNLPGFVVVASPLGGVSLGEVSLGEVPEAVAGSLDPVAVLMLALDSSVGASLAEELVASLKTANTLEIL